MFKEILKCLRKKLIFQLFWKNIYIRQALKPSGIVGKSFLCVILQSWHNTAANQTYCQLNIPTPQQINHLLECVVSREFGWQGSKHNLGLVYTGILVFFYARWLLQCTALWHFLTQFSVFSICSIMFQTTCLNCCFIERYPIIISHWCSY